MKRVRRNCCYRKAETSGDSEMALEYCEVVVGSFIGIR